MEKQGVFWSVCKTKSDFYKNPNGKPFLAFLFSTSSKSYLTLEMGKGKFLQYDQIHFTFSATMQYIHEFYEKLLFLVQINCRGISLILQKDVISYL